MDSSLAAELTRAASTQTFYTIRFLVDRGRTEDAYRAYAYFRWVDDVLDSLDSTDAERRAFLERQEAVLDLSLRGQIPPRASAEEAMLIELVEGRGVVAEGLQTYLRHMTQVMRFDVCRRGQLISQAELDQYTRWLAIAVTEAMHCFIGNGDTAPVDERRYRAVTGAHILHMLRDTCPDVRAGYFNVPREVLNSHAIGPDDIHTDAYRAWVAERVDLARSCFQDGRAYLELVRSARHRLAVLGYMARFEWLIQALENDAFQIRSRYPGAGRLATGLRMSGLTLSWLSGLRRGGASSPIATRPG